MYVHTARKALQLDSPRQALVQVVATCCVSLINKRKDGQNEGSGYTTVNIQGCAHAFNYGSELSPAVQLALDVRLCS